MMYKIEKNTEQDSILVRDGLIDFNIQTVEGLANSFSEESFHIKDKDGKIIAGLLGEIFYNWFYVSILWVDQAHRKSGVGVQLLHYVESLAKERNCLYIKLDTFHFQALEFYKKQGYSIYGELKNTDERMTHYFLVKYLREI